MYKNKNGIAWIVLVYIRASFCFLPDAVYDGILDLQGDKIRVGKIIRKYSGTDRKSVIMINPLVPGIVCNLIVQLF